MSNRDRRPPETEIRETIATDETIVELYWKRDETAIRLTDEKYGKYLYAIAYRILHDSLDCEECLNDTYLGTWNCIPPAKPNPLQLFVSKIMRNIAIDRFRGRMASRRVPSEMTVSLEELDECLAYSASPSEGVSYFRLDYLVSPDEGEVFDLSYVALFETAEGAEAFSEAFP